MIGETAGGDEGTGLLLLGIVDGEEEIKGRGGLGGMDRGYYGERKGSILQRVLSYKGSYLRTLGGDE